LRVSGLIAICRPNRLSATPKDRAAPERIERQACVDLVCGGLLIEDVPGLAYYLAIKLVITLVLCGFDDRRRKDRKHKECEEKVTRP
jgi:hypothetical protein